MRNTILKIDIKYLKLTNLKFLYIFFIMFFFLSDCGNILKKEFPQKKYFILEPDYSKINQNSKHFNSISVVRVKISPYFEGKNFVYRQGEFNYESDFYNEFLVFPSNSFLECTTRWLSESNTAEILTNTINEDTYLLFVSIDSLYIDFRNEKSPRSVLEIQFSLQKNNEQELVFKKKYSTEGKVEVISPEEIIKSWNMGLTDILQKFESDLRKIETKLNYSPNLEKEKKTNKRKNKNSR
jgi:cholesterol transport system auxiliary component